MKHTDPLEPLSELDIYEPTLQIEQMEKTLFGADEPNRGSSEYGETFEALMMGTLIKAVSDYVRYKNSKNPRLREQAKTAEIWLFAETDPLKDTVLGSFGWVCMVLDRDPVKARERIRKMTVNDLPKVDRRKDR